MLTNFIISAADTMDNNEAKEVRTEFRIEKGDGAIRINKKKRVPVANSDIYDRARVIYFRARHPHMGRAASIF